MTDVLQRILSLVGNELLLLQAMLEHAADVVQPVGAGQVTSEAGRFQPLLAIGFALALFPLRVVDYFHPTR